MWHSILWRLHHLPLSLMLKAVRANIRGASVTDHDSNVRSLVVESLHAVLFVSLKNDCTTGMLHFLVFSRERSVETKCILRCASCGLNKIILLNILLPDGCILYKASLIQVELLWSLPDDWAVLGHWLKAESKGLSTPKWCESYHQLVSEIILPLLLLILPSSGIKKRNPMGFPILSLNYHICGGLGRNNYITRSGYKRKNNSLLCSHPVTCLQVLYFPWCRTECLGNYDWSGWKWVYNGRHNDQIRL